MLKVTHISLHQQGGGAAIASLRIHQALKNYGSNFGIDSHLRVRYGSGGDSSIHVGPPRGVNPLWLRLQPRLTSLYRRGFTSCYPITHSIAEPSTGLGRELRQSDSDLINLHWLGDQMLSIEEIGSLSHPIIWTLHDQWPFSGAEHYEYLNLQPPARYQQGYTANNRPEKEHGPDLCRRTWERKHRSWRRPFTIVCPSQWLANCVRSSSLMSNWPVHVIPLPIDTDVWRPIGKRHARAALGLPQNVPILAFGAMGGNQVHHKGGDLLLEALHLLCKDDIDEALSGLQLIVFGQNTPTSSLPLPIPVHYLGILQDPISMRLIYSAADLVVVPSRIEAFGQVALEAQSCGTAVASFAIGGLLDIVANRISGIHAEAFDTHSLAMAIRWSLAKPDRAMKLGEEGRRRALQRSSQDVVASQYAKLYHSISKT